MQKINKHLLVYHVLINVAGDNSDVYNSRALFNNLRYFFVLHSNNIDCVHFQ